jgi:hypothetical protein
MPTKERWAKMSLQEKQKYNEQHKKWAAQNRERSREIANKSYLKKVNGVLSRISRLEPKEVREEHCRKRKAKAVAEWQKKNPDKVAASRLKQKLNGNSAAKTAKRRAITFNATPSWADLEEIKNVYLEARYFGMHVDHIIPLNHPLVCGLHVWDNLQLLNPIDNIRKGNKYAIHEEI